MMNRKVSKLAALVVLLGICVVGQADQRIIELSDGSRILGEVISLVNGSYTIRSSSLGIIKLAESQVKAISVPQHAENKAPSSAAVESIQSGLMNNASLMSTILELQNDPDMQAVLSDPDIINAVQRMDFDALRNNPKIIRLMDNTRVQQLQSELQ